MDLVWYSYVSMCAYAYLYVGDTTNYKPESVER